jgi:methylmalonyl-CoA/ethylmalonyl-CoA epimerase
MLPTGAGTIELITPLDDASSIARSLEKRGEGVHHICVSVGDIDAAMEQLRAAGARLLSKDPIVGAHGVRRVFVHPKSAHGVLIELYEE